MVGKGKENIHGIKAEDVRPMGMDIDIPGVQAHPCTPHLHGTERNMHRSWRPKLPPRLPHSPCGHCTLHAWRGRLQAWEAG